MNNEKWSLPSDKHCDYNFGEFGLPTMLTTADEGIKIISLQDSFSSPSWARFVMLMRQTVQKDRRLLFLNGIPCMASINWLRDHVHEMKAYKHWEYDLKSYIEFMIENQNEEGFFYEISVVHDNFHTKVVSPACIKELGDGTTLVRIEIEADVEYLVVEGVFAVYQATGDIEWVDKLLPKLEKSIDYMTSSPKRWDAEHGLVKRGFTIDSWDFVYGRGGEDRNIYPDTPMAIMHGDNSGVYQAMKLLAFFNRKLVNGVKADEWERRALKIKENLKKYCWNGDFYIHQLHLNSDGAEGADESRILSLSNAYDINRGVTDIEMSSKILDEYIRRKNTGETFAEWFSINPSYDKFKDESGGYREKDAYINGGIASFVAGELAKAAFNNGYEQYGWDILCRVRDLVSKTGQLYFLYNPETGENLSGGPSGWGAAAIIDAIDNGLAGIIDEDALFESLKFAPKWVATGIEEINYRTGYEISKKLVETKYKRKENSLVFELTSPAKTVECHILLPENSECKAVSLDGKEVEFAITSVNHSKYVDFSFENKLICDCENEWKHTSTNKIEIVF